MGQSLTSRLDKAGPFWLGSYALTAAFLTYFSMYAFRKPFTVGTYEDVAGWENGVNFKIAIVVAQVLGYALSKLIGIKIVSEAKPALRGLMIIGFILLAEVALVAFAIVPAPWKVLAIFFNGLPLGMIWGLVFSYMEGRRISEILGAGLCASFIVSSGFVKSVGRSLVLDYQVPEFWMPALTGLLFLPLLALSVYFLSKTPPPNVADEAERMKRVPMTATDRRAFFSANAFGLVALIIAYVVLSALRDFRDNFAVEIWSAVGFADSPEIFALSELPVAAIVLVMLAFTMVIRNNRHAVLTHHWIILFGALVVGLSTFGFQTGLIGPVWWMIAVGAGLYLGYVPYNSVLSDRLTAALRMPANAAFFIYLADTSGYAGSVSLLLIKNFATPSLSWLSFFTGFCYIAAALVALCTVASFLYFRNDRFPKLDTPREAL